MRAAVSHRGAAPDCPAVVAGRSGFPQTLGFSVRDAKITAALSLRPVLRARRRCAGTWPQPAPTSGSSFLAEAIVLSLAGTAAGIITGAAATASYARRRRGSMPPEILRWFVSSVSTMITDPCHEAAKVV